MITDWCTYHLDGKLVREFRFNELVKDREKSFQQISSFVGRVVYTLELQGMEVTLNNKVYNFCGVPERVFDQFKSAGSKGAFFNRSLKGIFNC